MSGIALTWDLVESFSGVYLSPRYDDAVPTPQFHRDAWKLYTSGHQQCMVIAPRQHAKSTALTVDYILAEVCFRSSDYVILIGSTEDKAGELLSNIREELQENDTLRRSFYISSLESDTKTEVIVRCTDGHRFRILARGAEQKIRGAMWKGKRPNLIVCDDMEDDEQVENKDRRRKFRNWFFRAAKQALSRSGKIRVHGTILHDDSLLSRLRKNSTWNHLFYKAHAAFDDFSDLLWPQAWNEEKLRKVRQEFIDNGDAEGYSQEYLNDPADAAQKYLRKDDLLPMQPEDYDSPKLVCAAWDFAISKRDHANRTSCTVGGKDGRNILHFIDQRVDRWDSEEIIEEIFSVQASHRPDIQWVEDGQIWLALWPIISKEMLRRGVFINFEKRRPILDKASRGRAFQKRTRAHACRFDHEASWYPTYEEEVLKFTGYSEATLDDQFDSSALLALGFESLSEVEAEEDFMPEEEFEMRRNDPRAALGRNTVTGY